VISSFLLFSVRPSAAIPLDGWRRLVGRKLRTLVLPMVIWNGAMAVGIVIAQSAGAGFGWFPALAQGGARGWADALLALTAAPLDLPLYFLRDLFVCFLLSPVLGRLLARHPIATLAVVAGVVFSEAELGFLLRPDILLSFAIGSALAIHRVDVGRWDACAPAVAGGFLAAGLALAVLLAAGYREALGSDRITQALIPVGIAGFWSLSAVLERSRFGRMLARAGRYSFLVFCIHYPLMMLEWMAWQHLPLGYPLFYVLAPVSSLAAGIAVWHLLRRRAPTLLALIDGGCGGSPRVRRDGAVATPVPLA
jgi:succinoglycan biosynthesis protein ExoH